MDQLSNLLRIIAERVYIDTSEGAPTSAEKKIKARRALYVVTTMEYFYYHYCCCQCSVLPTYYRTQQRLELYLVEVIKLLRQLEMKVEPADCDHRNVVKPALQMMICLIARVRTSSCGDTSGELTEEQTHADGTKAITALLKTWNSKLLVRQSADDFIKVSRKLVNWLYS